MKRISACFSAFVIALCFTACAGTPVNSIIKGNKPWDLGSDRIYERSDYTVTRYAINDDREEVVGEGKMYFILESENEIETTGEQKDDLLRLRMHFELDSAETGRDTIDSEVIFTESAMKPIWMHKKAVIVPPVNTYNESYELEICYNANYYRKDFKEKYDSPKAYFARSSFEQGDVSSLPVKDGDYFDNEELFFLIRSMQALAPGASLATYISNGFDIFDNGKFFTYLINIICASDTVNLKMNDVITSKFSEENLVVSDEDKLVPCILSNAYINGRDRGIPIVLYYAKNAFSYPKTSYNLMKMETSEYSAETRKIMNRTEYELTNYSAR